MRVKKDVFGITKGRRLFEKIVWFIIAIGCIAGVLFLMDRYVKDRTETVDIVIANSRAITQNQYIESMDIKKYAIIKKEYNEQTMFLWSDSETVIGNYASYYIKEGTPIYKDAVFGEKRYRNEWMYEIGEDQEVLTIPFDYRITGGNIMIPGDKVRIRAYYEGDIDYFNQGIENVAGEVDAQTTQSDVQVNSTEGSNSQDGFFENLFEDVGNETKSYEIYDDKGSSVQVITIFDEIEVIDMLANGQSIYEKYLELKDMTEVERQARLKDKEFVKSIIPDAMIVLVNEDEAKNYLQASAVDAKFLVTILSRESNETILDKVELIENVADDLLELETEAQQGGE